MFIGSCAGSAGRTSRLPPVGQRVAQVGGGRRVGVLAAKSASVCEPGDLPVRLTIHLLDQMVAAVGMTVAPDEGQIGDTKDGQSTTLHARIVRRQTFVAKFALLDQRPPITDGALVEARGIVGVGDAQCAGAMVFVGAGRLVAEPDCAVLHEVAAAIPVVAAGPEGERGEVGRLTDRRPLVSIVAGAARWCLGLAGGIQEELAIGREIAQPLVDAAMKPLPLLKGVVVGPPAYQLRPVGRAAPQDGAHGSVARQQHIQSARRLMRSVGHWRYPLSSFMRRDDTRGAIPYAHHTRCGRW